MATMAQLEQYLIDSTLLDSPVTSNDPTFAQVKSSANQILTQIVGESGYTISTLPTSYEGYILLLAKKEVYFRLATLTAPEFNMETEFSKLLKGDRWQHYYKLLELTIKEIARVEEDGSFNTIIPGEIIISGRDGTLRNYRLAENFAGEVTLSGTAQTSVNVDWTKFVERDFAGYEIFLSLTPMYDPYIENDLDTTLASYSISITDPHRDKLRVTDLSPNTLYYLCFVYRHSNGLRDIISTSFTTLEVI